MNVDGQFANAVQQRIAFGRLIHDAVVQVRSEKFKRYNSA
jgi:hypothetical protein